MVRVIIDRQEIDMPDGATILDAACKLGISIPTMCFLEGRKPQTSCMVCLVKTRNPDRLVPACGTPVHDGLEVESETEEVHQARKAALELLLSEHVGECLAPCHTICPAGMNVPRMIRQIEAGEMAQAICTVKADLALPAVLGRICEAPCENGCRRKAHDDAVSICLLERHVADWDLAQDESYLPPCKPDQNKRVAIVGAGPAGLAAAYQLQQEGYGCTVFDDHDQPGGSLRYEVSESVLSRDVLQAEIGLIGKIGVRFLMETRIGDQLSFEDLQRDYDAVLVTAGAVQPDAAEEWTRIFGPGGIEADRKTFETRLPGVFAAGSVLRPEKYAVRALAQGKKAAFSIAQYLSGEPVTGYAKEFTTSIGKLTEREMDCFLSLASPVGQVVPANGIEEGLQENEAREEAMRCCKCGCDSPSDCKLRLYSAAYDARPGRFKGERKEFLTLLQHPNVIHNPGKCILCGLCIQITKDAAEELGLAFAGRGFEVKVVVPFGGSMKDGLARVASECVEACPTGALVFKEEDDCRE